MKKLLLKAHQPSQLLQKFLQLFQLQLQPQLRSWEAQRAAKESTR